MIQEQERRDNQRVKYFNTLYFKAWNLISRGRKDHFRQADIVDICSGGVKIRAYSYDTVFDIGSTLCMKIPFPNMPILVTLFGKVVWLKSVKLNIREAGIQFITWE